VGPGVAIQRLARVRIDPALVLPVGFAACAGLYWLSLALALPWLFPVAVAAVDLGLLWPRGPWLSTSGPSLRGALPPVLALVAFFALTEYPMNRPGPRGEFLLDSLVPEDTTFHVALAFELTVGAPPQVPGLSGVPLGYHLGLPLVRAAAARWAGVHPFDSLSRYEITLTALAAVLALRAIAAALGAGAAAVAAVGWTLLATDFSFLFAWHPTDGAWLDWTDANLLFSLAHANSSVIAMVITLGALLALKRHEDGEGKGWLVLAAGLGFALPHFKAFMAAHFLFGLAVAALLTRRWREALVVGAPALVGLASVVLGRAAAEMRVVVEPFAIARRLMGDLDQAGGAAAVAAWAVIWTVASLGLRLVGLPEAVRTLRRGALPAAALAAIALSGWPIGLLFRVMPVDYQGGRPAYNEAWYFIEQSAPLLWIFAAIALAGLIGRGGLRPLAVAAACAALALPSTVQWVVAKRARPVVAIPPAVVEAMAALKAASRLGDVVLQRPEPRRYPPPPMILIGRRVPFTRFIPYLYQGAPRPQLEARLAEVRRFFKTEDPAEALAVARSLGARYVCLYADDAVAFKTEGVLKPLYEQPNVRVYAIVGT
jgi:hypothetical protein